MAAVQGVERGDIDLSKVGELGDRLLTQIDALRSQSPIHWSESQKAWLVTGHAEVVEGFRGDLPLSVSGRIARLLGSVPQAESARIPNLLRLFPKMLISLDPPEQLRLRKLMLRAFSKKVAEGYRPFVRALVERVLTRAGRLRDVEFVEDVARPIAGRAILELMGLPEAYADNLRHWAVAIASGLSGGGVTPEMVLNAETTITEMQEAFLAEIRKRRAAPIGDFISALAEAEEDGERLTDEEIVATCVLILIAGHDTTTNTMTLGTAALARDADALNQLRTHATQIDGAVMELMRVISMSTSQVRMVSHDFVWRGHSLKAGDMVYLFVAGANRDPTVFEQPTSFDFARGQEPNMTFGPGMHHCIGHFLAKMQLGEYFSAVAQRVDRITLADEPLEWGSAISFRGVRRLPLRLDLRKETTQ